MKNKVVVITGASGGIGKALALKFGREGSSVVISGRDAGNLENAAGELRYLGAEVTAVQCDVSDEEQVKKMISETVTKYGGIDVLINNAGLSMRALFSEVSLDVLRKLMDVNFWGTVYCTKYALPHLQKSRGSIIGISSIAGKKGLPGRTGYSASKFAMEGFLQTLRIENLKSGVHVLVVSPGFTASNIRNTALGSDGNAQGESPREENKMMQPGEVADRIYAAVISRKRDVVMTGEGKLTVWLNKFFPAFMDKMVYNHMAKEKDSPLSK